MREGGGYRFYFKKYVANGTFHFFASIKRNKSGFWCSMHILKRKKYWCKSKIQPKKIKNKMQTPPPKMSHSKNYVKLIKYFFFFYRKSFLVILIVHSIHYKAEFDFGSLNWIISLYLLNIADQDITFNCLIKRIFC